MNPLRTFSRTCIKQSRCSTFNCRMTPSINAFAFRNYSSLEAIKELRRLTDAPLGQCKKAIAETNGDIEEAKKWLQKQGIKTARKKAGRTAAEGLVGVSISADNKAGVLLEVNCETDFSANTATFRSVVQSVAKHAEESQSANSEALLASTLSNGTSVADELISVTSKIGENVQLRRFERIRAQPGGSLVSYIHNAQGEGVGEIGVIVSIDGEGEDALRAGRQLCMQITALNPQYITMEDVPASVLEDQKNIETVAYKKELEESGKKSPPDNVVEKIIAGKVYKKLAEEVLMAQEFIMDPKKTVEQALPGVKVHSFVKYRVGDGVEKVQTNLAEEVSKTAGL